MGEEIRLDILLSITLFVSEIMLKLVMVIPSKVIQFVMQMLRVLAVRIVVIPVAMKALTKTMLVAPGNIAPIMHLNVPKQFNKKLDTISKKK